MEETSVWPPWELRAKDLQVTLVEQNKSRAYDIVEELPDVMVIHGDGRSAELLEEENVNPWMPLLP